MATEALCLTVPRPLFTATNRLTSKQPLQKWQVRCSVSSENATALSAESRRSANYQPSTWSYDYLQSLENDKAAEKYKDRATKLEAELRSMIKSEETEPLSVLELIDNIGRLGLSYKFETDIKRVLETYMSSGIFEAKADLCLHATALCFKLLRQYGFEVSQDVFSKFLDQNGNFRESIQEDVQGMLSLYQASYLAFEGELDAAKEFTRSHLKNLKGNVDKNLAEQVKHILELPSHHRTDRIEAHWNIEAYRKRADANKVLLELAILDFNMVQSVFQRELEEMIRWWRNLELASELSFARDRLMECFFWAVGMVSEPQFGGCRKAVTKVFALVTLFDDVYDVYGTLEELELLTDAVERWDVDAINELPGYMKLCFLALFNTVNDMAYEILKEKGENVLPYLTKAWADLCKSFLQEAKWLYNKEEPTYDEYFENGWRSSSGPVQLVHSNFALSPKFTKQELDSLENYHELLRWPSIIFRLCNDLVSASAEIERGETANAVYCYMLKTGVTEDVAKEHIRNVIDESWKMMNKESVYNTVFATPFIRTAFGLARTARCQYQYGDGHSNPDNRSNKRILSVIIKPMSLIDGEVEH